MVDLEQQIEPEPIYIHALQPMQTVLVTDSAQPEYLNTRETICLITKIILLLIFAISLLILGFYLSWNQKPTRIFGI
jgi:hypothetical protein